MSHAGRYWNPSTNEEASADIQQLADTLSIKSVLDIGCGTGRNLAPFDRPGSVLYGIDIDEDAITQTRVRFQGTLADEVHINVGDVRSYNTTRKFDLVICYGVLHFLAQPERIDAYRQIKSWVRGRGYAAVVLFNARIPIPPDLQALMPDPPSDSSELREVFSDWQTVKERDYVYSDEHPGGIHHIHSIDRLIARSPEEMS